MPETQQDAHRLEIRTSNSRVRVSLDGVVLAETDRPVLLKEGKLPTRFYIPTSDVKMDLLTPTGTESHCPFKGDARYWSVEGAPDVAWSYDQPIEGAEEIAGLVCFYNEKVDLEVDGTKLERPTTRWS